MAATQTPPPAQTPPAQPLDGRAAYDAIYQNAYVPAWREKIAGYGIQPQTVEEEQAFLQTTHALRHQYEVERQKKAAAGNPALNMLRTKLGFPTAEVAQVEHVKQAEANQIKKIAAALSFNPDIAHAALSMLAAK